MEEYNNYDLIVRLKILILKYGVKFSPINLFNKLENINQYKIKKRVIKPIKHEFQVYDESKDETIIPSEIIMKKDNRKSIVKLRYSETSPLELKIDNNQRLYIEIDGKKQDINISLVKNNSILKEPIPNEISSRNATIGDYIDIVGVDRVSILFFEGCYNWISGKPCKFCDLHPKEKDEYYKPTLNNLKDYNFDVEKWWNASKDEYLKNLTYSLKRVIEEANLDHIHILFMAGNLPTNTDIWNVAEETIKYISKDIDLKQYDNYLNIAPHDTLERIKKIKDLGINQVQYNLEVVDEKNFDETCPGKMPYKQFLNKLIEAVDVFGKGKVRSNFVLGLDDFKSTLKFAKEISKKGIVFDYSIFQPKKCTPYYNRKTPDFDKVLEFTNELAKLYIQYNFKPIFCSLSSRSSLVNEIYWHYLKNEGDEFNMSNEVNVKIGDNEIKVELDRPELIYGIEGLYTNEYADEKEAYIEVLKKSVPIIHSKNMQVQGSRFFIPAHNQEDFEYAVKNNWPINQVVAPYFYGVGEEKVRDDIETQKRHSVIAVIKHDTEDKYLCVDCKGRICKSFVLGGIEQGETPEEAALREVKEETGYTDVNITHHSPFILINHFYAGYKGVNRYATLDILFGKLNSEENIGISENENKKHVVKWISRDELNDFISVNNNKFALDILLNGEKAYTGDGVMINSDKFNGMNSEKARDEIEEILNKE